MIMKVCKKCGKLIPYPMIYCGTCLDVVNKQREESKGTNRGRGKGGSSGRTYRDPKYRQFYKSKEWKTLSKKYMQDKQYKCECCGVIASEVHHIEPIQTEEGWLKRLDYKNLKAVCVRCHNKEHNRFNARNRPFKRRK